MKKILSTTLVAVAFAMVSTVDAKKMVAKRDSVAETSREIVTVAAKVVDQPTPIQMPTEVKAVFSDKNLSADERDYAEFALKLDAIKKEIAFKEEELKGLNLGWFAFFTAPQDKKDKRDEITQRITDLKNNKKQVESDISALRPVVGDRFVKAMQLMALGISAAITASVVNTYFEGKPYAYVSEQVGKGAEYLQSTRAGQAAARAKARASEMGSAAYQRGVAAKDAAVNRYNTLRGKSVTAPTVTAPQYNIPEYR
jgi:hypothetical protein